MTTYLFLLFLVWIGCFYSRILGTMPLKQGPSVGESQLRVLMVQDFFLFMHLLKTKQNTSNICKYICFGNLFLNLKCVNASEIWIRIFFFSFSKQGFV